MFHVMATFLYTENGPAEGSKHQLKILFLNVVRSFVAKSVATSLKSPFNRRHYKCFFFLKTVILLYKSQ